MIDALRQLYEQQGSSDPETRLRAQRCLAVRDFYLRFARLDPFSGDALPRGFSEWLLDCTSIMDAQAAGHPAGYPEDRFVRLLEHAYERLVRLLGHLRRNVTRDYAMLPIHEARELDSNCLMWLSRQPGRTIRQKLSGRQNVRAVRRYMSFDTSENRLLKAFLSAVRDKADMRHEFFPAPSLPGDLEELVEIGTQWLHSEDAAAIGRWNNPLPNHVLLQDKEYRKIWQAWKWLLNLEDDIASDMQYVEHDVWKCLYWQLLTCLFRQRHVYFLEQPCQFKYDKLEVSFGIPDASEGAAPNMTAAGYFRKRARFYPFALSCNPAKGLLLQEGERTLFLMLDKATGQIVAQDDAGAHIPLADHTQAFADIVAAMLLRALAFLGVAPEERPLERDEAAPEQLPLGTTLVLNLSQAYVCVRAGDDVRVDAHRLVCQSMEDGKTLQSARMARALYVPSLAKEAAGSRLYSLRSLCLPAPGAKDLPDTAKQDVQQQRRQAAQLLVSEARDYLRTLDRSPRLVYLLPDGADDFGLFALRQQFGLLFHGSTPLPRSIAGGFALAAEWGERFPLHDGDWLFVLDEQGLGLTLTPLFVRIKVSLAKQHPESHGLVFERHPALLLRTPADVAAAVQQSRPSGVTEEAWQQLASVWGIDGLAREQEALLFALGKNGAPYQETRTAQDLWEACDALRVTPAEIATQIAQMHIDCQAAWNVLDLTAQQAARGHDRVLYLKHDLTRGAVELQTRQDAIDDPSVSLWYDHLPALSMQVRMDGRAQWIELVPEDHQVMPQPGRRTRLPAIAARMSLPEMKQGVESITFPLRVGQTAGDAVRYQARLRSPLFPLAEELPVHLEMYYTYGAPEPYELFFVTDGGKSFKAEWTEGEELKCEPWMVPEFPPPPDMWEVFLERRDYYRSPEPYKKELPIPEFLRHWLDDFSSDLAFLTGSADTRRFHLRIDAWQPCGRYEMGKAFYDGRPVDVPERAFAWEKVGDSHATTFRSGVKDISCELQRTPDGWRAYYCTPGFSVASETFHCWRRPLFQVRSLGLPLAALPDELREAFSTALPRLTELYFRLGDDRVKEQEDVLRFACVLGDDMPDELGREFCAIYRDASRRRQFFEIERWLGYALGSVQREWQKDLLQQYFAASDFTFNPEHLYALAHALWLDPEFVHLLSADQIRSVLTLLLETANVVMCGGASYRNLGKYVTSYMETALGLLRARANGGACWRLLNPQHLQEIIDKNQALIQYVRRHHIEPSKSFLVLTITRPDVVRDMDDLHYAVTRMLNCDNQDESQLVRVSSLDLS